MKLTIVDLEMNQPSGRIIQLGAVVADLHHLHIDAKFERFVNPGESVSSYITDLTGIEDGDLHDAPSLADATKDFWNFVLSNDCAGRIAGWGDDPWQLSDAAKQCGVSTPDKMVFYDVQKLFKFFRAGAELPVQTGDGLKNTVEDMGMDFVGTHHDALHDSLNTAKILIRAVDRIGSSCFDKTA